MKSGSSIAAESSAEIGLADSPRAARRTAAFSGSADAATRLLLVVLVAGFVLVMGAGLGVGAVAIAPGQVLAILASVIGIELPWSFTEREAAVLLQIRAPRVVLGAVVGAALALGGVLMQALFRNPLADPGLIGVSSGAAVAAAAFTVLGPLWFPAAAAMFWGLPAVAVTGGLLTTLVVVRFAQRNGRTRVEHLLLAGIAINALAGAAIGLLMLIANDAQLREVAFWSFGSLGRADWTVNAVVAVLLLPILLLGHTHGPWLNALLLGEGEARLLGVPVEGLKRAAVILTCMAVGGAVAFTGLIGFVGLVVPHVIRLIIGSDHRVLIPASALLGATLLPLADVLSRTVAAPVELPIGLVSALLGAPFFLFLLVRDRGRDA